MGQLAGKPPQLVGGELQVLGEYLAILDTDADAEAVLDAAGVDVPLGIEQSRPQSDLDSLDG
jgi:hypothetical protein